MKTKLLISLLVLCRIGNTQTISCGTEHSLSLCSNNSARSWGANTYGSLGDATTTPRSTPVQVMGLIGVIAVAGGSIHSLFLKNDSTVWACGYNGEGELGDGTSTNQLMPVQVSNLTGIIAIMASGCNQSLFIKSDGTAWACGFNGAGQLGDGTATDRHSPVQVVGLTGIISAAGGVYHSLFLKNDSTVWACGANNVGQLGLGFTSSNKLVPVKSAVLNGITAVGAGNSHSLFLKSDGTVWACGDNTRGQLGDGTTVTKTTPVQVQGITGIIAVASKHETSLFLKNDGTVWACGNNQYGQLGNGSADANPHPTPAQVLGLTGIVAIASGNIHSLFLKNDGTVWACGYNGYGQLGNGTTLNDSIPEQVIGLCNISSAEENEEVLENISIYPNPSAETFTIESKEKEYAIILTNTLGEKILSQKFQNEKSEIDLSTQPAGIYFLFAKWTNPSSGGQIITREAIISKKIILAR
ncbi:MAG: T9SS type A sorting domain-containing protein [Bacteroidetes bacterium]|nr:T9SS type A sorting domain-containing protein [Bacteroidota bacterium]